MRCIARTGASGSASGMETAATSPGWTKAVSGLPTINRRQRRARYRRDDHLHGGHGPRRAVAEAIDDLERRLLAEEFDLVAVGRALIGDPDFVRKVVSSATMPRSAPSGAPISASSNGTPRLSREAHTRGMRAASSVGSGFRGIVRAAGRDWDGRAA